MSWEICTSSTPVARKDYRCDASEYVCDRVGDKLFSFADYRIIVRAKREGWKIKKGQRYTKTTGKWDGEWLTFRARQDMHELCLKHDLYPE